MFIKKENLTIRNAEKSDAPLLGGWWRSGEIMSHAGFPLGLDITDEKIIRQLSTDSDDTYRILIIEIKGKPSGEMSYHNMGGGAAQIGIKICDTSLQNKGYGTKLIIMLIRELFTKKGYDRIILDTNYDNLRAQHIYEKIGFRRVNVRYDCWRDQTGKLQSIVDYELKKSEFLCEGLF